MVTLGDHARDIFESPVNRRSPGHHSVCMGMESMDVWRQISTRMVLHFMSNTRVDSEQLPGSPSMARAKKKEKKKKRKRKKASESL